MCLWILTACLGQLLGNQSPVVVVPGVPSPIILPTATPIPSNLTTLPPAPPVTTAFPSTMSTVPPAPVTTTTPPSLVTTLPPPPVTTTTPSSPVTIVSPPPVTTATPLTSVTTVPPPSVTTATPSTSVTTVPPPPMTPSMTTTPPPSVTTATPPPMTITTALPPVTTVSPLPVTTVTSAPMTTVPTPVSGILIPLVVCANPDNVCVLSPKQASIPPIPIRSRLGITPEPPVFNIPDTDYSVQLPSFDMAVKFPRSRRDVKSSNIPKDFRNDEQKTNNFDHNIAKRQSCVCVTAGTCIRNLIDIRIVTPMQCPSGQEYCCGNNSNRGIQVACGVTQLTPPSPISQAPYQASFGEIPWTSLVTTSEGDFVSAGVLIDGLNVLTVAHRFYSYGVSGNAVNLKVRLGEYDRNGSDPWPYQEYIVSKVFNHPMYNPNTLQNDITVLRLASAVPFTPSAGALPSINRICLPPAASSVYTGQRCIVSGWGHNSFGTNNTLPGIIKKVDVPVIDPTTCQTQLQATRLGATFRLDTASFICAGAESNKDACTEDGGNGLTCQVNGQWVLVGIVAWGIGCGSPNVPGVYVNVAAYLPWIQQTIATS